MFLYNSAINKANSVKQGDMVSWNSSGGVAQGKVVRVVRDGVLSVPQTSFQLKGDKDNPAVLIQLYRDGKPTDKQVGHKMSSLSKSVDEPLQKHGSHDQSSHNPKKGGGGAGGGGGGTGSDKLDLMNEAITEAKADIKNRIAGAERTKGNSPRDANPDVFDARVDGVIAGYKESAKVVGNRKALTKLRQDSSANIPDLPSPSAPLSAFTDRAKAQGFREAVLQISDMYGDLQGDN